MILLHGFGQRYDLPIGLALYLFAAGGVVLISFVLVVLFAVAASNAHLALAAALVYALAYTLELGLSMVAYFGAGR